MGNELPPEKGPSAIVRAAGIITRRLYLHTDGDITSGRYDEVSYNDSALNRMLAQDKGFVARIQKLHEFTSRILAEAEVAK